MESSLSKNLNLMHISLSFCLDDRFEKGLKVIQYNGVVFNGELAVDGVLQTDHDCLLLFLLKDLYRQA